MYLNIFLFETFAKFLLCPTEESKKSASKKQAASSTPGGASATADTSKSNTTAAATTTSTAAATAAASSSESPATTASSSSWSGYFSKAVSSYLLPTQVSDVLAQDRAFATAVLAQPGLKHVCGLARLNKELCLLVASEDGFLYIHDFNTEKGGPCKLQKVHDLRYALEGVIGK